MPEFEVIVVGAGPSGSAAALVLARKGVKVIMLEKARVPGEKNMMGGVLYGDFEGNFGMNNLIPDFESTAPLERSIVSHEVVLLDKPDRTKGVAKFLRLTRNSLAAKLGIVSMGFETGHDYSVLRGPLDRWLANRAVEAGAVLATETTVEGLLTEGGLTTGVRTMKEEINANLVIDASGVTSKLVSEAGLRRDLVPRQLYQGIKRLYRLDRQKLEERFRVKGRHGRALFFTGSFLHGIAGGAFLYTNTDTLSVGLLVSMDSFIRETSEHFDEVGKLPDVQDEFEAHPIVAELLEGAVLVEYSAHNLPKGFKCILKRPYSDGFVATGDALGALVKMGPMVDGMRRAIASGMMAATAYLEARGSGSFRRRNLSRYGDLLTPIYEDVNRSGRDSFVSESSLVYHAFPRLIFGTGLFANKHRFSPAVSPGVARNGFQRVQEGATLSKYDKDEGYSHIKVNNGLASKSITKPWVPTCPVKCYTIVTSKGVFASFKDLYEYNLGLLSVGGVEARGLTKRALSQTRDEIAGAELKFDHAACVSCGTCGAIGPPSMVVFGHERGGHGVRYAYG